MGSREDYSAVSSLCCSCIWSVHTCCFSVLLVFSLAPGKITLLSPACVVAVSGVFTLVVFCASCFFIGSWEDYSAVSSLCCSCICGVYTCCFPVLLVFSLAPGKITLLSPACVVAVSGVFTLVVFCASCFFIGSWEDYSAVSSLCCSCICGVYTCCFPVLLVFSLAPGKITLLSPACVVAVSGVFTLVVFCASCFFIGSREDYSAVSSLCCSCIWSVHTCCFLCFLFFHWLQGRLLCCLQLVL